MYALDTSVISSLYRNYYRNQFPSLWKAFDGMVADNQFTSTKEVLRELGDRGGEEYDWATKNQGLFATPNADEAAFVGRIYEVKQFQANFTRQKLLFGGRNADPFLIARASTVSGTVVTMEQLRPSGARIPNICQHFDVPCLDLRGFMEKEKWVF